MAGGNLYTGTLDRLIPRTHGSGPRRSRSIGSWIRERTDRILDLSVTVVLRDSEASESS